MMPSDFCSSVQYSSTLCTHRSGGAAKMMEAYLRGRVEGGCHYSHA